MQTTHAKAIKYLGIATIVLAGLTLLGCLIGMIGMTALGSYAQSAYPVAGYGYGHHGMMASGSYSDIAGIMLGTGIANALFFWKLACAVVALIAGIMALRLKDATAHNLRTVFIWALVAAICSLLAGSFITMTLLIIIAVFAEMDRKALEGGTAQAAPVAPATAAPANSAYAASYGDAVQPVAAGAVAVAAAQAPVTQTASPAVAENAHIAEEATAAAVTYEEGAAAVIETAEAQASEAAATAENAHIAEEGQAAADFYQDNAEAVTDAAAAKESFEANPTAPATMEAQGEAEELKAAAPVPGAETVSAPETVVPAEPEGEKVVAEAEYAVETTAPAAMEAQGEAEELKADEAMTKQQDSPEQL